MPEPSGIFLVGREMGTEDQLTEMLAWLCDAVPEVAGVVVGLAIGADNVDLPVLELMTQHGIARGRLDAVLATAEWTVVVESKLDSVYGGGQLHKYIDWLADETDRPRRALMSLTAHAAPWPPDDVAHAIARGVQRVEKRWEDLYDALAELAAQPAAEFDGLATRLVNEFLDMLKEEGLIPMKPLTGDELQNLWSKSQEVIARYHDYFRACKEAIAEALDATPHSNRSSAQMGYIYQDFKAAGGELIGVGIAASDEELELPEEMEYRDAPYVWLTIEALDWPDWDHVIDRLEDNPPDGRVVNEERWYDRPQVWRYLDDVVGDGSFAEQKERFAAAAGQGLAWLASAVQV